MVTMLFRCMRAELIKLKRSFIWIVFLILPILSTLMGCFNYLQNIDILTDGWYALCDAMERGDFRPALVIGVPVGFVNVVESKERLMEVCQRLGVPAIAAMGRKGGSSVAAAICNALLYTAAGQLDPAARGW